MDPVELEERTNDYMYGLPVLDSFELSVIFDNFSHGDRVEISRAIRDNNPAYVGEIMYNVIRGACRKRAEEELEDEH